MARCFASNTGGMYEMYQITNAFCLINGRVPEDDNELEGFIKNCKGIKKELNNPSVKYLASHGHKVQAIKLYREKTGCTIKDAVDFIKKYERSC